MTSSYTILLLFQVQIHSTIVFISQDLVYFNRITSNTSIFKSDYDVLVFYAEQHEE